MTSEMTAAFVGAIVGSVATGLISALILNWQFARARKERFADLRLQLVREILRHRMEPKALVGPLNELPIVFAHDKKVLAPYRAMLTSADPADNTPQLAALLLALSSSVGLGSEAEPTDLLRGLTSQE